MGRPMREDIPVRDVALKWLGGQSMLSIASEYGVDLDMIRRRIKKARKEMPELPWAEREPANKPGPTQAYRNMNDGKQGESVIRQGSVLRGSRRGRT
jgi:hypothetical protein